MKIKTQIILYITTLLLIVSTVFFTYALLESKKIIDNVNFSIGNLTVELQGSLISDSYLVPGKELIEVPYKLVNTSTINIDIQMIIIIELDGVELLPSEYSQENGTINDLIVVPTPNFKDGNKYLFENIPPNTPLEIINSLEFNGFIVRNLHSGRNLRIYVSFSAKQSDHANFGDLGVLDIFNP